MSNNFNPKVFDLNNYEEKIDKLIERSYTTSFMSNSKWEKLFSALDTEEMILDHVLLKLVNIEHPIKTYMPKKEDLEGIWVAEGKNDYNYFYKEIEWIELLLIAKPSNIPYKYYNQTIELANSIINVVGQFETEHTPTGLRIYGHKT